MSRGRPGGAPPPSLEGNHGRLAELELVLEVPAPGDRMVSGGQAHPEVVVVDLQRDTRDAVRKRGAERDVGADRDTRLIHGEFDPGPGIQNGVHRVGVVRGRAPAVSDPERFVGRHCRRRAKEIELIARPGTVLRRDGHRHCQGEHAAEDH